MQVDLQNICVNFVYQGPQVMVKYTGAKRLYETTQYTREWSTFD